MTGRRVRAAPHLVPNPRPRTPPFRVPRGPAVLALYPRHVALAGLVAGLVAGPRSPAPAFAAAGVAALAAAAVLRSRGAFAVPLEHAEDDELDRVVGARPASVAVPVARAGLALGWAAVALVAGAVVAQERAGALDRTALAPAPTATVRGVVTEPPKRRAYGTTVVPVRLTAEVRAPGPRAPGTSTGAGGDGAARAPAGGPAGAGSPPGRTTAVGETVLLRVPDRVRVPEAGVGEEVRARGRLRDLREREAFERRRGVHAVLEADEVAPTGRVRRSAVDAVRRRAEAALERGLDPERAALARGMVLGQDHALPEDLRDAFRTSGLAHLLAASGQNVMLLATLVLALATAAGIGLQPRLALALAAVACYVPLAGAGPSIQRAGVMGAAGLVAALAGRPSSRWYAVLLAAAVTLALDPRACEDVGWQLSFAAVISILALHARLRRLLRGPAIALDEHVAVRAARAEAVAAGPTRAGDARHRARMRAGGRRLRAAFADAAADAGALTIAATLGTAPLMALHFEQASLVSLPANLLAAPAVAPVMWLGTLAGVLGGEAAVVLDAVAGVPLGYLAALARASAAVPHASVPVALPGPAAAVAVYAALGALCLVRLGERSRRWLVRSSLARAGPWPVEARAKGVPPPLRPRWATIFPLAVLLTAGALLAAPGPPAPPAEPTLSMLDVGQGDAILLQDGGRAALFDTGRPGSPLVEELRGSGVRALDVVVLTHSSADHEGNLAALLRAFPVGIVLDGRGPGLERGGEGGTGRFEGLPPRQPRAIPERGRRFSIGRIAVEILWPPPGEERRGDPNLTAVVAVARTATSSALLTADAESPVTLPLDLPDVDVLKVAHHGSADPGLPALLEELTPRTALIPVGRNTYGHPAPETLAALRSVPDVRRTDRDGTIRVPLGP